MRLTATPHVSTANRSRRRCRCATEVRSSSVPLTSFTSDPQLRIARIINGCWQFAGGHGNEVFHHLDQKLAAHAEAGFTTFDTADIYGPSEQILGQFQKGWRESGKPPVQILTKYVPNIFQSRPNPAAVELAICKSLRNLQLESLDLVQMHWWDYNVPGMVDAALSLAELQSKGLIRHVGLTNMDVNAVSQIVAAGVPVACNQVQFSLLDRRPLNGMVQYCQQQGIKLLSYGSLGGGLLTDRFAEEPKEGWFGSIKNTSVDLNTSSLKMYWNITKRFGGQELWRELLRVLRGIGQRHQVSTANVALRWVMQQGGGDLVVPLVGLRSTRHIADNARVFTFKLDEADLAGIEAVLARSRGPTGDIYSFERAG